MAGHAGRSGCDRDYERAVDRAATIRLDRGRNVQIDYRWGAGNADRIAAADDDSNNSFDKIMRKPGAA